MINNKELIDDLEKIYQQYKLICVHSNYNCMKCPLCFSDNTNFRYYACDIVSELISTLKEYEKENENSEK